ncbi:hypothetical protein BCON_0632g00020 [Botryotinia convoluta]|uniref:Ecp2 effector protein domain-containing protein n=1 Tax=Botryotinia convoluta TaxID=54673 RepID=A0A4Z1HBD4_9HELO|nr:hypothetical protein BCON_0632g00020 [Botryotinia convoluta]
MQCTTYFTFAALLTSTALALPSNPSVPTSDSPFHDCLDSGKDWATCHQPSSAFAQELKRDTPSTSPFHDCLDSGKGWEQCHLAIQSRATSLETRGLVVVERGIDFEGVISSLGINNIGGTEQCYSTEACSYAVDQALKAGGLGKFTKSGQQGFYRGNAGPIVTNSVKFFLSTMFQGDTGDLPVDLHRFGQDLCTKGVDHLISDPGCTAARKSGGRTEHTSVNGGAFNWAPNGATAIFDNSGLCTNCIFSMVMEAANKVDKDGTTAVDIDS